MIVSKKKANRVKSKASHIKDLTDYIRDPKQTNPQEKVLYAHGRGFLCEDHRSQQAEMVALASEAVRSPNPVAHYVLSWREGEQPSPAQAEEAVSLFLDELGLKDHQAIYALHKDTDNVHLHLAINRVHPDSLKVIKPNKGFDIEAAHKAIARIEHAQGWEREQHGRYQVLANGELDREHTNHDRPRQPEQRKRDMEHRTGEKSAERIAIEEAAPILKRAQSWEEVHRELAEKGMRYEKTGSGAVLFVGEVGVKASSADRAASLGRMQKRLGDYQPPPRQPAVAERAPEPIQPDMPGWESYIAGRKAHYAAKARATREQRQQHQDERKRLSKQQRIRRDSILKGRWHGRIELRNALQSALAKEQRAEKGAVQQQQRTEREQIRRQYRPYPDLEQWQRQRERPDLADRWRYRASERPAIEDGAARFSPERAAPSPGSAVDAYQRHSRDVLQRERGTVDLSRVDALVAIRMRVTGHAQGDIENAIRQGAPALRTRPEGRDWNDYAARAARYAFGAAGDRQAEALATYRPQWERLEGREQGWQEPRKVEREKTKRQEKDREELAARSTQLFAPKDKGRHRPRDR